MSRQYAPAPVTVDPLKNQCTVPMRGGGTMVFQGVGPESVARAEEYARRFPCLREPSAAEARRDEYWAAVDAAAGYRDDEV